MIEIPYDETYLIARNGTYTGSVNDNKVYSINNSDLSGWLSVDGDVMTLDFDERMVNIVRVYYVGDGTGAVSKPETIYIKNGVDTFTVSDFSSEVPVGAGPFTATIYYIDIQINQLSSSLTFGFTQTGQWTMILEVDLLEGKSASLSGITRINSIPAECTVRIYNRADGGLIDELVSDSVTGEYQSTNVSSSGVYDVVCIGDETVCPQISGPLTPPPITDDYRNAVLASGPTCYWTLDDVDSTLTDIVGTNNGVITNSPINALSPLTYSGNSMKFNGVNQYCTVSDSPEMRPGTGEYAIELWMAFTGTSNGMAFGKFSLSLPFEGPTIFVNYRTDTTSAGSIEFRDQKTAGYFVDSGLTNYNDGIARHYVFQRMYDGVDYKLQMFINGALSNQVTLPANIDLNATEPTYVCSRPAQYVNGQFDEVAYYVGKSLTPSEIAHHHAIAKQPTLGDYTYLTSMDLQFEGGISDSSVQRNIITSFGSAQISATHAVNGATSLFLDGTGDYLSIPYKQDLFTILGSYTFECWIYRTGAQAARDAIITKYSGTSSGFYIELDASGQIFVGFSSGSFESFTRSGAIPINQWVHIAVCKEGTNIRLYVDGVKDIDSTIVGVLVDTVSPLYIGRDPFDTARDFQGHMDSVKWVHGVALYTSDFTPS